MEQTEFQIRKEEAVKAIEQQLTAKTGIDVTVRLWSDQIRVYIANYERYGFEGTLKRNWETKTYDKAAYNIGAWGSIDPDETLAGLYVVFGALLADKDIQKYILDAMLKLTAIAEGKEAVNE
jgi:hypothetical protein